MRICNVMRIILRGTIMDHVGKGRCDSFPTLIHLQRLDPLKLLHLNQHLQVNVKVFRSFYTVHGETDIS